MGTSCSPYHPQGQGKILLQGVELLLLLSVQQDQSLIEISGFAGKYPRRGPRIRFLLQPPRTKSGRFVKKYIKYC